jgi:hypothetical protein
MTAALVEVTVAWGEDTICTVCLSRLPAGAPAWPDEDGRSVCSDCADVTDLVLGESHGVPPAATAVAWQRGDGSWLLEEQDWGHFAGPTLGTAYVKAAAYITEQTGHPFALTVRLRKPGAPQDWQRMAAYGYGPDDDGEA